MTVIHIVLFKFRQDTAAAIKDKFLLELRKLKTLPCVLDQNLVVGGPSITTPIERSKGFHYCLISYHKDRAALDQYQASPEHHFVTSKYMWPFNEDLMRFDFESDSALPPSILGLSVDSSAASSVSPTPNVLSSREGSPPQ